MKKTLLASAIALSIGVASSVQAQTITITEMKFGGPYGATGTMNSAGNGTMTTSAPSENFNGFPWTADQQNWFDTHSSTLTWSGTGTSANAANAYANFTYTFHLESNQVAAGTYFDWNGNNNIPVLTIYDCPEAGGACIGKSLAMVTAPFPGSKPRFDGTSSDTFPQSSPVPVPAAVWLMGSGLLGLVGVARRRKVA